MSGHIAKVRIELTRYQAEVLASEYEAIPSAHWCGNCGEAREAVMKDFAAKLKERLEVVQE